MKEKIKIAAKMYDCQEKLKRLYMDEYSEKISFYITALNGVMATEKLDVLKAVLYVSELDSVKDNGMAIMLFMAAAVEIIESKPKKGGQHTNQFVTPKPH